MHSKITNHYVKENHKHPVGSAVGNAHLDRLQGRREDDGGHDGGAPEHGPLAGDYAGFHPDRS